MRPDDRDIMGYRGAGAKVAVLDTGFDTDHPDLAPNIDPASTNFVPGETLEYQIADPFSHGTHTAGTVAAADNGFGTIGVAPEADLLLVKVLPDAGCGGDGPILEGIAYAASQGADVISMSLGAPLEKSGYLETGCSDGEEDDYWVPAREVAEVRKAYDRVVKYARSMGATVIASAGNDTSDADHTNNLIHLPSDTPGVLSISATAPIGWATDPANAFLDYPTFYTNFGQSAIDFAAPGGSLEYPGDEDCTVAEVTVPCWVFDLVLSTGNDGWFWAAGTSMAAPHAAGVAAIIVGKNGGSTSPAAVERALRQSADDLGKPGNDDYYGSGRVNAYNAVK